MTVREVHYSLFGVACCFFSARRRRTTNLAEHIKTEKLLSHDLQLTFLFKTYLLRYPSLFAFMPNKMMTSSPKKDYTTYFVDYNAINPADATTPH